MLTAKPSGLAVGGKGMPDRTGRREGTSGPCRLSLTDEFALVMFGRRIALTHSVERVVAYLGLVHQPVHRLRLAGALWPDAPEIQAARSLRTALWRLHGAGTQVVDVREDRVKLLAGIRVDVGELFVVMRRLLDSPTNEALRDLNALVDCGEILPDWGDDWVVMDRERFRLLRMEALERGAERLLELADHGRALEAALASAGSDPLRESAHRLVVRAHLHEGNVASALRAYDDYRRLLSNEIGVEPSPAMQALVRPFGVAPARETRTVTVPLS